MVYPCDGGADVGADVENNRGGAIVDEDVDGALCRPVAETHSSPSAGTSIVLPLGTPRVESDDDKRCRRSADVQPSSFGTGEILTLTLTCPAPAPPDDRLALDVDARGAARWCAAKAGIIWAADLDLEDMFAGEQ